MRIWLSFLAWQLVREGLQKGPSRTLGGGNDVDSLSGDAVGAGLNTTRFGRRVRHYDLAGSTNDLARELALAEAPEGTVVVAEEQSQGRGRLGRTWLAPAGTCLLVSVIFRARLPVADAFRLTMLSSVAMLAAIERTAGVKATIKWPNDLLAGDKKLAGILSEASSVGDCLQFAVVGVGLNVNFDPLVFPEIAATATSLRAILGRPVPRVPILQRFLEELEAHYDELWPDGEDRLWRRWRDEMDTLGRRVVVTDGERRQEGQAVGVSPDGSLLLRREDGNVATIAVGDVTLRT